MIKNLKKLQKEVDQKVHQHRIQYDEEGRATIKIIVQNDDSFLSPYCNDKSIISDEVADFLEYTCKPLRAKEQLAIQIYSNVIDENEKVIYQEAISNYYLSDYMENKLSLKRNVFISIIMAVIAVFALALMITLNAFEANEVFIEVIDIFGWVFMWEAVDIFFIERSILRLKKYRYLAFIDAKITFHKLNINNE